MNKKSGQKLNVLKEKYGNEKRWVNYRIVKVPGRNTSTKVPYSPITKRKASSTDIETWGTYAEALKFNPEAIGIVFTPAQTLLGIDIDHCIKKGTNIIDHEHKEQIAELIIASDTYTEISPSGTGLHLYFELSAPLALNANRHENFEAYTFGRYFTVTNISYKEIKPVRTITPSDALLLLAIIGYPWGKVEEEKQATLMAGAKPTHISAKSTQNDSNDILRRMFNSKNGKLIKEIYEGRATASTYKNDQSAADMSLLSHLAFWTGKNPAQMEQIWLASPQGAREKTQKRKDYRDRSIATAISHCKQVYENKGEKLKKELEENAPTLELLFVMSKGEKIFMQNTENMCRILKHHNAFKDNLQYDTFKNTLEFRDPKTLMFRNLEDYDIINIQTAISILFPMFGKVGKDMIYDAVIKVCRDNTIDSAIDFIRSIKWDKEERLKVWLHKTYNTPDDEYHQSVGSNWFKGLVKRICEPGCKFDYVLVLEGEQGIKKSTSLGIIGNVYPDQPSWHVETTMSTENKDFFMQFSGKAIVEFSEGETLSRTEVKRMKAIITMQSDKYRPAYGRLSLDFPRRCVFAMTTNQTEYLKDETGNRRWLPVACEGQANIDWLKDNRDQLFAEAYHRVMGLNETTWEFPEEQMIEAQSARRVHSPNQDLIAHWYFNELKDEQREEGITVHQVYRDAIMGGSTFARSLSRYEEMEIADVLRNHVRLEKRRKRADGVQSMRWFVTEKSMKTSEKMVENNLDRLVSELKGGNKEIPF